MKLCNCSFDPLKPEPVLIEWSSYYLVKSSAAFKSYCEKNNLHVLLLPDKDYNLAVKTSKKAQLKLQKEKKRLENII